MTKRMTVEADSDQRWSLTQDWKGILDAPNAASVAVRAQRAFRGRLLTVSVDGVARSGQRYGGVLAKCPHHGGSFEMAAGDDGGHWSWPIAHDTNDTDPTQFAFHGVQLTVTGFSVSGQMTTITFTPESD
ncbi:hypothetical protein HJC99_02045 [Candidatus Saccharibacteria bacterium]|nr:hypothetical protein [Candidatus Saccharibacteria bacterium]